MLSFTRTADITPRLYKNHRQPDGTQPGRSVFSEVVESGLELVWLAGRTRALAHGDGGALARFCERGRGRRGGRFAELCGWGTGSV